MKVVPVLAAALVIYSAIPGSNQGRGKKPKPKFCMGADGNRYKKGGSYEDKEACISYTCTKSRNKFKMKMEEIQCVGNKNPQIQKTTEDLNKHIPQPRKEGEPFVLKRTWCFWLGCANAHYYKPCCELWQPYCKGLICRRKQKPCYSGWALVGSGCYRVANVATFEQARAFCEDDIGSLVEITSQIEQDTLAKFYEDSLINGWVWLGAQKTQEDEWRWISSGEKIIFNSWGSGEPNNAKGEENCLVWDGNESWKAVRCDVTDTKFKAICEERKEPLPQTTDGAESVIVAPSIKPPKPCYCGIPNRTLRIVGGKKAEKHEYPWQVALVYGYDNIPFCSGSLISRQTVLTAAHCTENMEAKDISVLVGEHDITDSSDEQRKKEVKQIIQNNLYNFETMDYDISLLILMNPVIWSKKAKPICLPKQSTNYENVKGIVSGWGTLEYNGPHSDTLLETEVMTMTNKECTTNKEYNTSEITSSMICATGYGRDACQGDSGGPLISLEMGSYYSVIGVVSWGKGCADQDSPGVYSRVAHQMAWITDNMVGQTCLIPPSTSSNLVVTAGYGTWTNRVGTSSVISPTGVSSECIPPLPVRILAPQSVYFNNSLMVCGGNKNSYDNLKSCYQLRDSNSQWTDGPAMNIKRERFSMTKAGQDLYALGGVGGANGKEILDSMEKMSGYSGEWILMDQNLTSTRQSHCTVFMESTMSLVIIGGYIQTWISLVEEFSLATTTWKELVPLPMALGGHGCAVMDDDTIVVTGGYNGKAGGYQNKVYQLVGGKWHTSGSLEVARSSHTMGILDNRLLILGGSDRRDDLDSMEEMEDDGNFRIMQWKLPAKRRSSTITQIPREIVPC